MKDVTHQRFYLVREDVLTEAMQKTLEAKHLLQSGKVSSIWDAVKEVDLSRSAFYKYRDAVFPFHSIVQERILTVFLQLEDREGTLARLLQLVAESSINILTIHQTIPIQGRASVTLSLDVTEMTKQLDEFINEMKRLDFVESAEVISSGAL
ncbi:MULTISPECIES: ACT domain-containing protein [Bacillaceae]|jgi:chorismate mutase|uniref:ACT domain-containing protein n=1 Tax=Bacillaceae TaxID=186817 RepID=UPI0006AE6F47|nr:MULTISPECIES: ACT domain-containing protein [Bacillaceae]ALC84862.1 ACT domain-containing protein [Bacillus sp. FJAT-22090]KQL34130.1 ACT domain-containing protein [Psychrobacillus sp. FJAT-21963]MDF2066214.1 ACT domain-containing protein [Bacillus sp. Cr_A10]